MGKKLTGVFGRLFSSKPNLSSFLLSLKGFLSKAGPSVDSIDDSWCPICGRMLDASRRCPVHGVMVWVLSEDPWAEAAVVDYCDSLGVASLEAV